MLSRFVGALFSAPLAFVLLLAGCGDGERSAGPTDHAPDKLAPIVTGIACISPACQTGQWDLDLVASWPAHIAIHAHLLPTGKVLLWPGEEGPTHGSKGSQVADVWDPETGGSQRVDNTRTDVFCSGHAFLPDGRLLVLGGHIADGLGRKDANLFDPFSLTWSRGNPMNAGRWYPTATALATGEVLVVGGTDETGKDNTVAQVWKARGGWRSLTTAVMPFSYYPFMFAAPDGRVFYAGAGPHTGFLSTSGTGSWSWGPWTFYGLWRDYGSAVMYKPGKILLVGGSGGDLSGATPTNTAETIDLNTSNPVWTPTGSMNHPRRQLNATVLPDGRVLVTGGTSGGGFNNQATPVKSAELWDPETGTWTELPAELQRRMYHSTAILLPDARVISAGGGRCAGCYINNADAQVFSPPYLFAWDGSTAVRPVIASAPTVISYGQQFAVQTAEAADIAKVSLIRLTSVTHAFNQNQRFVPLSFTVGQGRLTVTSPGSANLAPPGHYLLFILDANGVPSKAAILRLG